MSVTWKKTSTRDKNVEANSMNQIKSQWEVLPVDYIMQKKKYGWGIRWTKLHLNNNKKITNNCKNNVQNILQGGEPILSIYCAEGAEMDTEVTENVLSKITAHIFLSL